MTAVVLAALFGGELRVDERVAASALAVGVAMLTRAFCYTASEGAHPSNRWLFTRGADLLGLIALYAAIRVWL
ncbi:MAG: hypothetical protein M1482_14975 [Chloroflexi bacterium]|nr:hypothetical protein [Chloroflexota bacterium]